MIEHPVMTQSQVAELVRLRQYFPYRVVFGVVRAGSGAFEAWAKHDRRAANRLAREGHQVFILESVTHDRP